MAINQNVRLWRNKLVSQQKIDWPTRIDGEKKVWMQMIDGTLQIPWLFKKGDGIGFSYPEDLPQAEAGDQGADVLLFEIN